MAAVYKKEMRSFFTTPTGYVFCAIFLAVSGFLFWYTCLIRGTTDVSGYYTVLMLSYVVVLPLLTMRSLADEKRQGTDQLLLTSPVSISKIVLSKFFACFTMFLATIAVTLLYLIPLAKYGSPNVGRIIGCLIGTTLIAACFISIGIFVSSLTKSLFAASLGTIAVIVLMLAVGIFSDYVRSGFFATVLGWLSIYSRFSYFTYGMFDVASVVYYISICAVFLFLTVRVYERRRYS